MGNGTVEYVDCYENLANAIILQAVKDYKKALFRLEDNPRSQGAQHDKKVLERFFLSKWYATLTDLDPNRLMTGVKNRVKIEAVERRKKKAERKRRKDQRDMKKLLQLLMDAGAVLIPEKIAMLEQSCKF